MIYVISAILLCYVILLVVLLIHWGRKEVVAPAERTELFISVVIPARDEPCLHLLLRDLEVQSLPSAGYEIIVVDDHSKQRITRTAGEEVIYQNTGENGKKAALTAGINKAKGDVIVTLDADCRVGHDFLLYIKKEFQENDIVLSPGLIKYAPSENLFEKLQAMETAAVMGAGVALHKLGMTSLSNGANLAFKKELWVALEGYNNHLHVASGDDEFFVQEAVRKYPGKIKYRTALESCVSTVPNKNFSAFFNQRIRWAGKWRMHKSIHIKGIAILVFIFHLTICTGLALLFSKGYSLLILLFILKFIAEGLLIFNVCRRLHQKFFPGAVLFLQLIYSPYVVFFGVVSNFLTYNWKGRDYTH